MILPRPVYNRELENVAERCSHRDIMPSVSLERCSQTNGLVVCAKGVNRGPTQVGSELDAHGHCSQHFSCNNVSVRVAAFCYNMRPHALDHSGSDSGHRPVQSCWRLCPEYTDRSPWGKPVSGHSIRAARSAPKAVEQLESHTKGTSLPINDTKSRHICKPGDESVVISDKTQKLTHAFKTVRNWPRLHILNFRRVALPSHGGPQYVPGMVQTI